MNDTSSSLIQLRKLIQSLQKQESEQIQQMHGDALKQIVSIARDNDLSIDHIKIAISARQPKTDQTIRVPRKNKRHKTEGTHDSVSTDASVQ
jgi:deoxyribodipyrimidine photolyase